MDKKKPLLMALFMAVGMSFMISLFFTIIMTGVTSGFFTRWAGSFGLSILIAFPSSLIMGPLAEKLAGRIVKG